MTQFKIKGREKKQNKKNTKMKKKNIRSKISVKS